MLDNEPGAAESTAPGTDSTDSPATAAAAFEVTAPEAAPARRTRRRATKAAPPEVATDPSTDSGAETVDVAPEST
ncbi:MAG: hypothetical protein QOI74_2240, partial [Micromonosporaceae bacterium]|nr:hypothetical protein [Micromonosporaceae bacterium]